MIRLGISAGKLGSSIQNNPNLGRFEIVVMLVLGDLRKSAYGDVKRSLMRSKSVKMRSNRPNQAGIPYAVKGS